MIEGLKCTLKSAGAVLVMFTTLVAFPLQRRMYCLDGEGARYPDADITEPSADMTSDVLGCFLDRIDELTPLADERRLFDLIVSCVVDKRGAKGHA